VTRGIDGNDTARNSSAQGFAQYRLGAQTTIGARFFGNDSFTALNSSPFAAPLSSLGTLVPVRAIAGATFTPNPDDPDNHRTGRFYSGLATLTHQLAEGVSTRAQYQGLNTFRDSRNGPLGGGFQPRFRSLDGYDSRIDTAAARLDVARFRRHLATIGYEYERERYATESVNADPNPATRTFARTGVSQAAHAVFAQDQIRLPGSILATVSGRWQRFALSAPNFAGGAPRYVGARLDAPPDAFTGDAALAYLVPGSGLKLRAHVGNSYRAPALYERLGTGFFAGTFTPYGDPRLAPERAVAADSGFDLYAASSRVKLSGTYFYTRLQQVIGFDFSGLINRNTDPFGRSSGYRNTGGGMARGMEWGVEATPARGLRVKSAYTYTNARERNSVLIGGSTRSIRVSDHMFTAFATYRFGRYLDATFDLFAASHYWFQFFAGGNRPFDFPGPKKADLALSHTHPLGERWSVEFYTRIENVFNRSYFEDGFRAPKAWAVGGMKLSR
jgi:iron complex outermembrane receptor protein